MSSERPVVVEACLPEESPLRNPHRSLDREQRWEVLLRSRLLSPCLLLRLLVSLSKTYKLWVEEMVLLERA